jgi:hypothetical protein
MKNIFESFCSFLDEDNWRYRADEDQSVIKFGIQGETADFDCYVDIKPDRYLCILYVIAPNRVPPLKRTQAAEFLTRANYGLILGCFELDMDDGEIRYRTSVQVEDSEMSQAMVKTIINVSFGTMERYYSGLMSIIYGDVTVMEAIKVSEKRYDIKAKLQKLLESSPDDLPEE